MKTIPFFQRKNWIALITRVASLVLAISLLLPTFAAAALGGPEGVWQLYDSPTTLELFDGDDNGRMFCNSFFGNYQTPQNTSSCGELIPIRFTPQASTKVGCSENAQELEYLQALESVNGYEVCYDTLILQGSSQPLFFQRIDY